MGTTATVMGALLIAAALLDIFQTLFHPVGRGAMSDWTAWLIWRLFRRMASSYSRVLTYAGPVAILSIIVSWAALVWFGFALIYYPHLQNGFTRVRSESPGIVDAMALSIGALITLSEGSYAALHWLQILRGIEAIVGFGLLTASVSWLLSIYPVLELRRSIAQRSTLLHHAEQENAIDMVGHCPDEAQRWIFDLGTDLAGLRNRMAQFPITYYFAIAEPETELAGTLPYLLELCERAARSDRPSMRLSATVLGGAVYSFLELLAADFIEVPASDKDEIMRAYASDHMSDAIRANQNGQRTRGRNQYVS